MFHLVTFLPATCFFDYSVLCCCFRLVSKKSSKDHPGSQTLTKSWRWSRASIHPSPWYIRRTSADPRDGTSATSASASVASRHRCKRLRLLAAEVLAPPVVGTWPPQWKVPRINFMSPAYTLNVPRNSWVAVAEVYDVTYWSSLRWGPCTGSLGHSSWTIWNLKIVQKAIQNLQHNWLNQQLHGSKVCLHFASNLRCWLLFQRQVEFLCHHLLCLRPPIQNTLASCIQRNYQAKREGPLTPAILEVVFGSFGAPNFRHPNPHQTTIAAHDQVMWKELQSSLDDWLLPSITR